MLTVREALERGAGQLAAHPELRPTALPDAALLLMHLLGVERAALRAHAERKLDREEQAGYQRLLERRLRFEPVQYIVGEQEFYGLALRVTPAVLIPRPETELLVEAVLARTGPGTRVVDVGTGSGAIAIALAARLPVASVTAIDLSAGALAVARENGARHGARVEWLEGDLLEPVQGKRFDVVVSNPPYVPVGDLEGLEAQVRQWEPASALFAGEDGLEVYRRLIPQAQGVLVPGGLLAMEFGYGQRAGLEELLAGWGETEFLRDLQGIERVVLAQVPGVEDC